MLRKARELLFPEAPRNNPEDALFRGNPPAIFDGWPGDGVWWVSSLLLDNGFEKPPVLMAGTGGFSVRRLAYVCGYPQRPGDTPILFR
jgi:hypothetical protein